MSNEPFCEFGKSPTLPIKAQHGDEICDIYGNRYKYDAGQDAWISKGIITSPDVVTEDSDGIISPDIFDKLKKLEAYTKTDVDFRPFKLNPGNDAYWYYFRSSDKLIRFKAEGEDQLRIEVNKGRIYQILLKNRCPGKRGPKGDPGDKGDDGINAPPEECFNPSDVDANKLDFAIFTPTPFINLEGDIELPNDHIPEISVRLYQIADSSSNIAVSQSSQLAYLEASYSPLKKFDHVNYEKFNNTRRIYQEISLGIKPQVTNICGIPLSTVRSSSTITDIEPLVRIEVSPVNPQQITVSFRSDVPTSQRSIDQTLASVRFDPDTNIICGSIYLPEGSLWQDLYIDPVRGKDVCVKSRQKGPDGFDGDPGECRIRIVNCDIDSTNIRADCPIINVRLDCESDTIYTLCANIIDSICARYIILEPNSATLTDSTVLKSTFLAVEATLDECKRISHYEIDIEEDDIEELILPHWEPQPGCTKRRNFSRHRFDWIPATGVGRCADQGRWFSPHNVRNSRFPWDIQTQNRPAEDECCQEPFFWCPNVQETPCGDNPPPPPPPPPTPPPPPPPPPVPPPPVPPPPPPPPVPPPPTPPPSPPVPPPPTPPPAPPPPTPPPPPAPPPPTPPPVPPPPTPPPPTPPPVPPPPTPPPVPPPPVPPPPVPPPPTPPPPAPPPPSPQLISAKKSSDIHSLDINQGGKTQKLGLGRRIWNINK